MTTTANKRGLRKAAEERTKKHAQRTPLPPKGGVEKVEIPENLKHLSFPDSKSVAKAAAVKAVMDANGWSTVLVPAEDTTPEEDIWELTARRGNEVLWISWTKGVLTTEPMPTYSIADRTIRLRNASAVKHYAARKPEEGEKELEKVSSNRYFRKRPTEPKPAKLPFDPATATEAEVISALMGKAVAWHNRLREIPETATVGRNPRKIYFTEYDGERILNFLCPRGGHRAFRLTALIRVSGKGKITEQASE